MPFRLSCSFSEVSNYSGPILCYDKQAIPGSLTMHPSQILFETDIKPISFSVGQWKNLPAFPMGNSHQKADIPFDMLAGTFFLISRYEEYLPHNSDRHNRFRASSSFAFRHGFLELPVVDLWAFELLNALKEKYPHISYKTRQFSSQVTIDLDCAYAYRGKGFLRTALGFANSLATLNLKRVAQRFRVITNKQKDPFEIYEELFQLLPPEEGTKWFVHVGDWGKFDKPIKVDKSSMITLINRLVSRYPIGIHPSYRTYLNDSVFRKELSRLVDAIGQSVTSSRFHYLRFTIPNSYYPLIRAGITQEYSMGFPEKPGFRAGTCTPYPFFDLYDNSTKNLKIFPFPIMDSTLRRIAWQTPDEAVEIVKRLIDSAKRVNGTFISVWHVDYLADFNTKPSLLYLLKYVLERTNGNPKH